MGKWDCSQKSPGGPPVKVAGPLGLWIVWEYGLKGWGLPLWI